MAITAVGMKLIDDGLQQAASKPIADEGNRAMSQTPVEQQMQTLARFWWLPFGIGLLSIVAGVIVLIKPGDSLKTIAVIVGIFVACDGVIALIAALRSSTEGRGLLALVGVLGLVVGVILIRHPVKGITAVALLFGIWLVAVGVIRLVQSFEADRHRVWAVIVALVEIIAGIVIVSSPGIGLATLAILIGVSLIVNGASVVVLGVMLRGLSHEEGATHHTHAATA